MSVLLAVAVVAGTGRAQTHKYFDGTFGATWTSTKIVDTSPAGTFTSTTLASGGNPGAYRDTSHTFALGAMIIAHMNSAAVFDPAAEKMLSIDYSYDLNYFDASTVGGAVGYRLALLQAGSYYSTANDNIFNNVWTPFSHLALTAGDFTLVTGPGPTNPDFSCSGAPMTLGFMSANSQGGSTYVTKDSGLDNWSVTINVLGTLYGDANFSSGWTNTLLVNTTPPGTFLTTTPAAGGNPGSYLETTHTFAFGAMVVNHAYSSATYNPSVGAISSIDYSYDLNHFTGVSVGGAVAYGLSVVQGGNTYATAYDNIFPNSWQGFSHAFVHAVDFNLLVGSGPIHPDFSALGSPMTFGVVSANSQGGSTFVTKVSGMDNWIMTIRTTNPCGGPGQPFCTCDGSPYSGPCTNNGLTGHGCNNSANTGGAILVASGTTTPDTMVLTQSLELPTTLSVFSQGDATVATPITFGDGLRCIGGHLLRLFKHSAVGGVVSAPSGSDMSITGRSSFKGQPIPPGATRYYMVYYRDGGSVCPPATEKHFNVGNAWAITWL
jgi:hypothetical protein